MGATDAACDVGRAKVIAIRFLKYRPRSEQEIIKKLNDKDVAPQAIGTAVAHLKKIGFLDDALFAKGWIASRLRKPFGLARIRMELRAKGISDAIIRQEMPSDTSDYDETAAALSVAHKRLSKYKGIGTLKAKKRVYDYLVRRGFQSDAIRRALYQLEKSPTC